MRYVYAGPDVTIPVSDPGLRSRRRFQEDDSEIPSARRIFWRARLWPSRAFPGSMTNLAGSRSRRGRFAKRAKRRWSCSFWLEWHPGSSAVTRTRDPRTPLYARVIRASEATLTPRSEERRVGKEGRSRG